MSCSGYMAPEYARHGQFSVKSDVFSFGVLLLEIISGQKNSSFKNAENGENVEYMLSFVSIKHNKLSPTYYLFCRNCLEINKFSIFFSQILKLMF